MIDLELKMFTVQAHTVTEDLKAFIDFYKLQARSCTQQLHYTNLKMSIKRSNKLIVSQFYECKNISILENLSEVWYSKVLRLRDCKLFKWDQ